MDTPASRLSWVATTAKQAIDDIRELADLPFAASSLVVFANLALVFAGGRGAERQVVNATHQILSGLIRELASKAQTLHPTTKGGSMPSTPSSTRSRNIQQAAYMATAAIDEIHDVVTFGHAGRALVYMAEILVQTPVEDLEAARAEDPSIPGLGTLLERWKRAGMGLSMAAAS